jgi:hypothetical protein
MGSCMVYETQMIKIYTNSSPLFLVNVYARGGNLLSLNKITDQLIQDNNLQDCVITGDFNSHHENWWSNFTNRRGRDILKWAEQQNLVIMLGPTRLDKGNGTLSCIDLTLASPRISAQLAWGVINDNMGSDHIPLYISLNAKISENTKTSYGTKFNYEKADWSTFHQLCSGITLGTNKIIDMAECSIPA